MIGTSKHVSPEQTQRPRSKLLDESVPLPEGNVLLTVRQGGWRRARRLLCEFGEVARSGFPNALLMYVPDVRLVLERLCRQALHQPQVFDCLGRVVPVVVTFTFSSPEEFEGKAQEAAQALLADLSGRSFHVRMHRHGFKGQLSTHEAERKLGQWRREALAGVGTAAQIRFEDPHAILAVATLGNRAGLWFWTREDLRRYPCLRLD